MTCRAARRYCSQPAAAGSRRPGGSGGGEGVGGGERVCGGWGGGVLGRLVQGGGVYSVVDEKGDGVIGRGARDLAAPARA
jgi:hypothetical protein